MKRIFILLIALVSCCLAASAQRGQTSIQETQARLLDVNPNAYVRPLTVEVQVTNEGRITDTWPLTGEQVNALNGDLANIRSWGVFQSSRKHNCDLIVAATFDFKTDPMNQGMYILTVVGFPANFVNWKTATDADMEWIKSEKATKVSDGEKIKAIVK